DGAASWNLAFEDRQDKGFAPNDNDREASVLGGLTYAVSRALTLGLTGRWANYDLGVPTNPNDTFTAFVATLHHRENGKEWQLAAPVKAELGRVHTELRLAQSHRDDHDEDPDAGSFGTTVSTRRSAQLSARTATPIGTVVAGVEGEREQAA